MRPCDRPGCAGTVDETGFCDTCGRLPLTPSTEEPQDAPVRSGLRIPPSRTPVPDGPGVAASASVPTGIGGRSWVGGLVALPEVVVPDPGTVLIDQPHVPEKDRYCGSCGREVGRSRYGQPGLTQGICTLCHTPFSFVPRLRPDELVADRYEVVGCLAHGGLGWIHLARDLHLESQFVVLKGLINSQDPRAVSAVAEERKFLTRVDHPAIVGVRDFVTHLDPDTGAPAGYLVMDYVGGPSLHDHHLARERGTPSLPLEHVLVYGLKILEALHYLHSNEMLYCDLKPANVIRTGDTIKLIDLGAVVEFRDRWADIWGTPGFRVPKAEIERYGVSVGSDLYTVGKTLEQLFVASDESRLWRPAGAPAGALAMGVASCRRLVKQATRLDRARRFPSAEAMAEQLAGVLREVLALRDGTPRPQPSRVFDPATPLFDAGLTVVPGLDHYTAAPARSDRTDWSEIQPVDRPSVRSVALGLPGPQADPDDPAAGLLSTATATDAARLLEELRVFPGRSVEAEVRRSRAWTELGEYAEAAECLAAASEISPFDWRVVWARGLLALAEDRVDEAGTSFEEICDRLPGEAAPKIALALCAEYQGRMTEAGEYYGLVLCTDGSQAAAAFGLARTHLARRDRAGAVRALDLVPKAARYYDAVRTAAIRIHAGRLPAPAGTPDGERDWLPTWSDLVESCRRLEESVREAGTEQSETSDRLTALIRASALDRLLRSGGEGFEDPTGHGDRILGPAPLTEEGLRLALERSFRDLAKQAWTEHAHTVLIDLANQVRPRTRWTWWSGR